MITKQLGNTKICLTNANEIIALLIERALTNSKTRIFFLNAHCYNIAHKDLVYRNNINNAEFVLNDGVGINLGARFFGFSFDENLNGTDFTPKLLEVASVNKLKIFLLGGLPGVAEKAAYELAKEIPELNIVGISDGYFNDSKVLIDKINASKADILIVGLGVPLQENWISEHFTELDINLVLAVGAFLDFASKRIKRAPAIIQKMHMEWVFRLLFEPRRLWKRYLIGNTLFFYHIIINKLFTPIFSSNQQGKVKPSLSILGTRGIPAQHGGFETFAEQLSLYLVARGWNVTVYCQDNGGKVRYESDWHGVRLIHIPVRGSDTIGSIFFDWKSTLHALRERPLILTLGYNTALFCFMYRLAGVTNLINMDGFEWRRKKWSFFQRTWLYLNERFACLVANHLIADHPVINAHLCTRANSSKITMIPYGTDIVSEVDVDLLRPFGLEPGGYVLIIARTEPENSILEIVAAFSSRIRDYKLVLVGGFNPERYPYHIKIAAAAGAQTIFLGPIYDKDIVKSLRTSCRLYIHGHQVGGTNPSLLEAMAAGSPVLAHDNQFNRWVSGDTAHYFKDRNACCRELDTLLDNSELLASLGRAARERCKMEFSNEIVMSKYQNLLSEWWHKSL